MTDPHQYDIMRPEFRNRFKHEPLTTAEAVDELHASIKELGRTTLEGMVEALAPLIQSGWSVQDIDLSHLRWSFRDHLKDGSQIVDAPPVTSVHPLSELYARLARSQSVDGSSPEYHRDEHP